MNDLSVKSLHPYLQKLVLYQKAKLDVQDVLAAIKRIIDARRSYTVTKEEELACKAAILVALRVGAESSMVTDKWSSDRTGYADIVHACFSFHGNDSDYSDLGKVIKFSHICTLFSALLSNVEGPSGSTFVVLQAVYDLCKSFATVGNWKSEFLSAKHVGLYGKVVSICLEILTDRDSDIKCRKLALMSVDVVVNASERNNGSLCVVLPGLSSALFSIACVFNEQLDIVISCLKMFSTVVRICLSDCPQGIADINLPVDLKPEIRELFVEKNSDWKAETCTNIVKMVRNLCATLAMHHDELVRSTLLEVVDSIRNKCRADFKGSLDAYLFDLILTTSGSDSSKSEILHRIRCESNCAFPLHLHGKLQELSERIPLYVQRGTEGSNMLLQQLAKILSCMNEDLSRLATSRAPVLRSVFPALAASLQVDLRRLCISRGQFEGSSLELIKQLPFSFNVDICSILPICRVLANNGGLEVFHYYLVNFHVVELAFSEMVDSDKSSRTSLAIIITLIMADMKPADDPYILFSLAETCIEWLSEFRPKEHVRDDVIECKIPVATNETVLALGLVSLLAVTFTKIKEEKKQLKLLITFLYELLGLYAIPNWIVHDAADCALNEVSNAFCLSVSEFLYERGSYLIHRIALAAQSRTEYDHAPIVFSALLDRVDNQRMYHHVRHIVEDLLQALDRFMQEYCILILRSMLSFVSAVGRWFSELKPLEEEELGNNSEEFLTEEQALVEIQKKPPPLPITSVESVLLRTAHLLSSSLLPIRILVLKILYEGLWVLRNFDDVLLPTIHRNWEALIHRFSDEEFEVRQECVKVVAQMVKVSKTFVYRRVRHQMWPLVERWMTKESTRSYSTVSSAYKYQLSVIESCADIWIGIDALPDDVKLPLAVLRLYCRQSTNTQLRLAAEKASRRLEVYLEEKKWQAAQKML